MRRIRSAGTMPEKKIGSLVHRMGFRFRRNPPNLPGKPDLVFPKLRCIIDIRGCFWHQHGPCPDSRVPESRQEYWVPKLERNKARDSRNVEQLEALGWRVLVVWGCELNDLAILSTKLRAFLEREKSL